MSVYHIFLIHSSVDGHFLCFHTLAVVNSAAGSIVVHVAFHVSVFIFFFQIYIQGLLGHMVVLFLVVFGKPPYRFPKTSIPFSVVAAPIHIPTSSCIRFCFLHILTNICYLCSF